TPAAPLFGTAAFAAVETPAVKPMGVRLNMPSVARHRPILAMPALAPIESVSAEPVTGIAAAPRPAPAREPNLLDTMFAPGRTRKLPARVRPREDVYDYNEPAPVVKTSSNAAWKSLFSGLTPSPAVASAMFAVLFLFSALAIFFSAPSALSQRS